VTALAGERMHRCIQRLHASPALGTTREDGFESMEPQGLGSTTLAATSLEAASLLLQTSRLLTSSIFHMLFLYDKLSVQHPICLLIIQSPAYLSFLPS
jgi:hypothetical protein